MSPIGPLAVFVVWLPVVRAGALAIAASRQVLSAYIRRAQLRAMPMTRDLVLHGYRAEILSATFEKDVQPMAPPACRFRHANST
jgi:hypothetical protein